MQHYLKDIVHGASIGFHADVAKQLWHVELVPVVLALHGLHVVRHWVTVFNSRAEFCHLDYRLGAGIVFLGARWITDWTGHGVEGVRVRLVS